MNTITNELLDKACPSIRYRMRSEILGEAASSPGMKQIQNEIFNFNISFNIFNIN